METYTFTKSELQAFLLATITDFCGEDGVFDFSPSENNTRQVVADRVINWLDEKEAKRLDNSLAGYDDDIPFNGVAPKQETDDSISPGELGLQPKF